MTNYKPPVRRLFIVLWMATVIILGSLATLSVILNFQHQQPHNTMNLINDTMVRAPDLKLYKLHHVIGKVYVLEEIGGGR